MIEYSYRYELRNLSGKVVETGSGTIRAHDPDNADLRIRLKLAIKVPPGIKLEVLEILEIDRLVIRGFKRDYWSGGHRPYCGMLHDEKTDQEINWTGPIQNYLESVPGDGAIVEITVRVTGERSPLGDTRWIFLGAHHYGPEPSKVGG